METTFEELMADTVEEALDCIENGEGHLSIKLPSGITISGLTWVNCHDVVDSYRLGTWATENN
jgi:hypothetical protein